mmetsp:Transcript_27470/g.51474  ORF Transcript_27470/g.51474 Transcript_27470/m.51474 type:complete len:257 (-) Transcript_27470:47-817(-)
MAGASNILRHPVAGTEFLLLLAHLETALKAGSLDDDDWQLQTAKISSYSTALLSRLRQWDHLPAHVSEQYRLRIENLRTTLAASSNKPRMPEMVSVGMDAVHENVLDPECTAKDGDASVPSTEDATTASTQAQAANNIGLPPARSAPWRAAEGRRSLSRFSAEGHGARSNLESEMVDLAEGMKGAANTFLKTLQKDNKRLEDMQTSQQRSLDAVTAHSDSGKKLLRSGQMSFLCTMILVAISVIIFCMMVPFIIFT